MLVVRLITSFSTKTTLKVTRSDIGYGGVLATVLLVYQIWSLHLEDQLVPLAALLTGGLADTSWQLGRKADPKPLTETRAETNLTSNSADQLSTIVLEWGWTAQTAWHRFGCVWLGNGRVGLLETELEPESSGKFHLVLTVPHSGEATGLLAAPLVARAPKPKVLLLVGELMSGRRKHLMEQRSWSHPRPYPGYI